MLPAQVSPPIIRRSKDEKEPFKAQRRERAIKVDRYVTMLYGRSSLKQEFYRRGGVILI